MQDTQNSEDGKLAKRLYVLMIGSISKFQKPSWGARRIRKKSYAKVFRASVRAETSRLPVCGSAARRNRRLG